jgi:hypothetical protein
MALKNIEVFVDATPEGEKPKAAETVTTTAAHMRFAGGHVA